MSSSNNSPALRLRGGPGPQIFSRTSSSPAPSFSRSSSYYSCASTLALSSPRFLVSSSLGTPPLSTPVPDSNCYIPPSTSTLNTPVSTRIRRIMDHAYMNMSSKESNISETEQPSDSTLSLLNQQDLIEDATKDLPSYDGRSAYFEYSGNDHGSSRVNYANNECSDRDNLECYESESYSSRNSVNHNLNHLWLQSNRYPSTGTTRAATSSRTGWIPKSDSVSGGAYPARTFSSMNLAASAASACISGTSHEADCEAEDTRPLSDVDCSTVDILARSLVYYTPTDSLSNSTLPLDSNLAISPSLSAPVSPFHCFSGLSPGRDINFKQNLIYGDGCNQSETSSPSSTASDNSSVSTFQANSFPTPLDVSSPAQALNLSKRKPENDTPRGRSVGKKRRLASYTTTSKCFAPRDQRTPEGALLPLTQPNVPPFAREPASLRRAASLRSEASASIQSQESLDKNTPPNNGYATLTHFSLPLSTQPIYHSNSSSGSSSSNPPTAPTTPVHPPHPLRNVDFVAPCSPLRIPSPLPPIAPPPFALIPRAPLSREDAAEARLRRMIEREAEVRAEDGLVWGSGGDDDKGECGAGKEEVDLDDDVDEEEVRRSWELALGMKNDFRREVLEWILDVIPATRISRTKGGTYSPYPDLFDQLTTSSETRFHAAYLFLRYFFRAVGGRDNDDSDSNDDDDGTNTEDCSDDTDVNKNGFIHIDPGIEAGSVLATRQYVRPCEVEGKAVKDGFTGFWREMVTWDTAAACLALSVKYHRDVLAPLSPVYTNDFLSLSRHAIDAADLEGALRDVLGALAYRVSAGTPQAFLDELWCALPVLRMLLRWDGAWEDTQSETWGRLLWAVLEPDVLRFPLPVLTATAFGDSVVTVLARRLKHEVNAGAWRCCSQEEGGSEGKWLQRAAMSAQGVLRDVQEVLGISDGELKMCQKWWGKMEEEGSTVAASDHEDER